MIGLGLREWDELSRDPVEVLVERRRHIADRQSDTSKHIRSLAADLDAARRDLTALDTAGKAIDHLLRIHAALQRRQQQPTTTEETPAP